MNAMQIFGNRGARYSSSCLAYQMNNEGGESDPSDAKEPLAPRPVGAKSLAGYSLGSLGSV